ncbi:MAG: hypothetical protein IKX79_01865 [Desulfovibrionaceae bacterium]|nr:hypothetical protein [Desulfovibrionaceae bacterium]MBR5734274.1 hypothetical protein [Desulfovibrionaceae bacterium]
MKKLCIALAVLALPLFCASGAMASKTYVYCSSGKIELDNRNPQQMQSARGSGTYVMGPGFDYRMDAEKFAKQLGGVGAKCPRK